MKAIDLGRLRLAPKRDESSRLGGYVGLLLYLILGLPFAMPCLCVGGAIRGSFTLPMLTAAFLWLSWKVYRRTFTWKDWFLYLGALAAFSLWAEYLMSGEKLKL